MSEVRTDSEISVVRRAIEFWPYLFIVISVTGLAYLALSASR
jgi:hypothetical protein